MPVDDDRSRWLVEPPAAGEVRLLFETGEGVELSDEARAALDELIDALGNADVEGFARPNCPMLADCPDFRCQSYRGCHPLSKGPCASLVLCTIGSFF